MKTGKLLHVFIAHSDRINHLDFDDKFLFSASDDDTIKLWEKNADFALVKTLEEHTGHVERLFSDDKYLYSASRDKTARIWDKESDFLLIKTITHDTRVLEVFADDKYLYLGTGKREVLLWDKENGFTFVKNLHVERRDREIMCIFVDERFVYSTVGGGGDKLYIWDKDNNFSLVRTSSIGSELSEISGDDEAIYFLNYGSYHVFFDDRPGYRSPYYLAEKCNVSVWPIMVHSERIGNLYVTDKYVYSESYSRIVKVWDKNNCFTEVLSFSLDEMDHTDSEQQVTQKEQPIQPTKTDTVPKTKPTQIPTSAPSAPPHSSASPLLPFIYAGAVVVLFIVVGGAISLMRGETPANSLVNTPGGTEHYPPIPEPPHQDQSFEQVQQPSNQNVGDQQQGLDQSQQSPQQESTATQLCPYCGAYYYTQNGYCQTCGAQFQGSR